MNAIDIYEDLSQHDKDLFNGWVKNAEFAKVGTKTTVCLLTMDSGFEIVGKSACLDVSTFDATLGKQYALIDALRELEQMSAFHAQQTGNLSVFLNPK